VLNLLFGNVLTITTGGVIGLTVLALAVALVHWLFYKEFLFVSFDPDMAMALGLRAHLLNIALFLTIGPPLSTAIRAAGAVVVFDVLVLPAATALVLGRRLPATFTLAVAVGMFGALGGIALSYVADWPSGPTIVAVNLAVLSVAVVAEMLWRAG